MTRIKKGLISSLAAIVLIFTGLSQAYPVPKGDTGAMLDEVLVGDHRPDADKARDKFRNPKETLLFFGLAADMTVVEITPGAGWYTRVLAPVMKDHGTFYGAIYKVTDGSPDIIKRLDRMYRDLLASNPDLYGNVQLSVFDPAAPVFAPAESADMVLTFRNVHNWAKFGTAEAMFKGFYDALKPGGTLGVVEHRAKPGTPFERQIESGYMTEAYTIKAAEQAGFKLVAKSEINANPKDTADHPGGVWNLPPNLRGVPDAEKSKYRAIGESDRMTLKFVKP
ncbi:MAG: methyltransferase [Burkholderiales bacterium]